ncbi:MAG: 3-hydroxyacyl-CoA dehydrogenase family protein [Akkermansiaceae bacterium]
MNNNKSMDDQLVAVVGLGPLGRGIVACCISRGFSVIGIDLEEKNRQAMKEFIPQAAAHCLEAEVLDAVDAAEWEARLELSGDLVAIADAGFVIEAIPENLPAKKKLFQQIEEIIGTDVPMGSNTSAFPITDLQRDCKHPDRVFGMHWSSHGHVTRFMELIPGEQTSQQTMARATVMAQKLGKEPAVLKKDIAGFLCNRIAYAMYREAVYLLESGVADAETIEASFRNSVGLWAPMCGPLRVIDVMGGGAFYSESIKGVLPTMANSTELQPTLQSFIDQNAKGPKNNIGFFDYESGDATLWAERFTASILATRKYQDQYIPADKSVDNESAR